MKVIKNMVTSIEQKIIQELTDKGERITYTATSNLFYEGQVPVVAYLILSGNVHLMKSKKIKSTIGPGSLIGVKELMKNEAVEFSAMIMPETEVCFLSRSDIFEIIDENSELSEHISQLLTA
ncbi:Crp/Fnr family transcriptional regulator [Bacteriovorax sp. DB6_IX]|uniref:Crp/Fnr family transcriptional regulator n=1 Tax=Bacteriovorax sp. DB6_IX TaxID=1353530 RepID=UPI0009DB775C|nr:Crp/Fnr family transcriptional regulator [Bacteriovorax sp. DB6_IX]